MPNLNDKNELDAYINDLILNRQDHQNDDPLEMVGALIYAIQSREYFNIDFSYFLKNVSLSEKKQIKAIIERSPGSNPDQQRLFSRLIEGLPKDKIAKRNGERRGIERGQKVQSNTEFLNGAQEEFAALKRKLGDELKKKVPNIETVQQLQIKIYDLQERVEELTKDLDTQKKARQVSLNVIDSSEQTQQKLTFIAQKLQALNDMQVVDPQSLKQIQDDLSTNRYAYSHIPQIRQKAQEVLLQIRDIRDQNFTPDKMEHLSILETLKHHKQWGDNSKYDDQKFGQFTAEHIKDFYVMHRKEEQEQPKNDVKIHVSINPDDANDAMEVMQSLATSEKYAGLIHEYKIADIDYIKGRNQANENSLSTKLTDILKDVQGVDIQALVKELKDKYPDVDPIIERLKGQVPEEQKASVENALKQVASNELGAIISGERILNEALFTVYFNQNIDPALLKEFIQDVNDEMNKKGIRAGNIAKTDVGVGAFCGVTIDHIVDPSTGQRKYLEGSKPEDVERRQKALRDNTLTRELVPQISPQVALRKMGGHQDDKDGNGMSALTAKGLSEIPLEQRIAFAGQLVLERYKQTNNVNLVYRNPDMYAKWVVKETMNEIKFPIDPSQKAAFFNLVEKAIGTPPDNDAKEQLKQFFSDEQKNRQVTQMLAPFYKQYMDNVKREFHEQNKDKYPNKLEYNDELGKRMNEAKKQFLGHVSFPFVESLVFELEEKDGFTPEKKGKLAAGFRTLREGGIMSPLLTALDKSYTGEQEYQPPKLEDNTIYQAFEIYENGNREYLGVKNQHETAMEPVRARATELYKIVNKIASSYPKDSDQKALLERMAGSIENLKTELDHKLLRGERITAQDVERVSGMFDVVMKNVKDLLNNPDLRGENPLHEAVRTGNKELTEVLLKAGCDPRIETTHYKRGFLGAIKDAMNGKPKDFFKNLTNPPKRSVTQLAQHLGQEELLETLRNKELELNNPPTEEVQKLLDTLQPPKDVNVNQQVDVNPKGNVFQIHRVEDNSPRKISDFVAGWTKHLKDMINEMDKRYNDKQTNRDIYSLKRVLNYLEARPNLDPTNKPDLEGLRTIIQRIRGEAEVIPFRIEKLLTDLEVGFVLPPEKPKAQNLVGEETPFVAGWREHVSNMMENGFEPKHMAEEILSCLQRNPAMTPDNISKLEVVFDRIKNSTDNGKNIKPELKEVIDGIRAGEKPIEKVQLKR
ncbi:MAG: ankyrin repeat domain-containing protein [Candidatus Berkiella sp.]